MNRRDVLITGAGALRVLGEHVLGPAFAGWQGTMLEVTYPPGAESAALT